VHRIGVWGREVPAEERIARQARQLLQCYGIVTRQSLEADPEGAWDWGALYRQFQLMEMRGEVRRGYFVQGLPGVQFALPEAVERLREWTQPQAHGSDALVRVNATDPANLFGPAAGPPASGEPASDWPEAGEPVAGVPVPGMDPAHFVRIPANYVVLLRGRPVLLLEAGGARLTSLPELPVDTVKQALRLAVEGAAAERRRLAVAEWNGEAVLDSPLAPLLEEVGFRREMLVYVWD
jgi:ATP-dependent Lhr-like helicase